MVSGEGKQDYSPFAKPDPVTDLVLAEPAVLFALGRECGPFLREFRPSERFPGAPCWARFCGPSWLSVLVLQTGMGAARSQRALDWLLSRPALGNLPYLPKVVLAAGFSGSLHEERRVGDVILATEVVTPTGGSWATTWPGEFPPGDWRPRLHRGRILSVSRLVADPAEKRQLGEGHGALAVDMESSAVAQACVRQSVPFGCVRVISDDLDMPLSPRLVSLLSGSRVAPFRVLAATVRQPRLGAELWRLARQTRVAAEQLARALGELLTLTLPWCADL